MATMAGSAAFIDTNVLVHVSRRHSRWHGRALACLERARGAGQPLWISRQVVREYLAVVTRPQGEMLPLKTADAILDAKGFLIDYNVAPDGPEVLEHLLDLLRRFQVAGKQVHDTNLVATALAHGITTLLTFNIADFRRFDQVIEIVAP